MFYRPHKCRQHNCHRKQQQMCCLERRKKTLIKQNYGSFNMSTVFGRYCAVVVLAMISVGKHGFIDLQLDKSPRQPGAFGCKPQWWACQLGPLWGPCLAINHPSSLQGYRGKFKWFDAVNKSDVGATCSVCCRKERRAFSLTIDGWTDYWLTWRIHNNEYYCHSCEWSNV